MKKLGIIFAIVAIAALVGCGTGGGSSGGAAAGGGAAPYIVDLHSLKAVKLEKGDSIGEATGLTVRNRDPFTKNYDDLMILFPQFPVDVTKYSRITIKCKYFDGNNNEIKAGDGNAMVVLVYDINGDKRGPAMDAGPNTPLKEMNLMGYSGAVSSDRGVRIRLGKAPGGILFQNSNIGVKYIECTGIIFHNGDYSSE
jgi:hypothetical protein